MGTRVFPGRPLDGDEGVDASLLESDAMGKNLATPSFSWSGLIPLSNPVSSDRRSVPA